MNGMNLFRGSVNILYHSFGAIALLVICLLVPASAVAAPQKLIFAHIVEPDTPKGRLATMVKDIVEHHLGDEFEIIIYPNTSLIDDADIVEEIRAGRVHFGAPSLSKFERYTDRFRLFDLPFLFEDMEALERFQASPEGKALLNTMQPYGIKGLGYVHNGMKQLSATRPIVLPKDVAGLSVRIMHSDVIEAQFKLLDANPIRLRFADVYQYLAQGKIQSQENTWSNIYSKKFYEFQPYITETNHGVIEYVVITSTTFWYSLTPEQKEVFELAFQTAINYANAVAKTKDASDRQRIANNAYNKIITLDIEQRRKWVEATRPVWDRFEKSVGQNLIQAALKANRNQ